MADQILDARTLLWDGGDGTGGAPDDLAGTALNNADTLTFIEGASSEALSITNSILGILFDAGSAQDYSDNTFWLWINCGVVGLLNAKASAGCTIRFCGATVSDWFEVYVGGNDSWPVVFEGGWAVFVIDIEQARADAVIGTVGGVNGTTTATSAIRYVGVTAETSVMPKMSDNFFMDAIYRNPTANAAWTLEGQSGGTVDWDFADVATELGIGAGLVIPIDGDSFYCTGPGQFGINDTETHGFTSLNDTILWADQEFVLDGFYGFSALGNSGGVTNVTFGVKTGTGVDATGAQGAVIKSGVANARWEMDFNDPNLDLIAFYGCSLIHGGDLLLDDPAVEVISSLYIDCTSAVADASEQLRSQAINPNVVANESFLFWDDTGDPDGELDAMTHEMGAASHHAIEFGLNSPLTMSLRDVVFIGFNETTDAQNDSTLHIKRTSGTVTINIVGTGTAAADITFRTDGATVVIQGSVDITLQGVVSGSQCAVYAVDDDSELMNEAAAGGDVVEPYSGSTPRNVIIRVRKASAAPFFKPYITPGQIVAGAGLTVTVDQIPLAV